MDRLRLYQLWHELDERLPGRGLNQDAQLIQGNWSCWNHGMHIFGSKGMDYVPMIEHVINTCKPERILEIGFNAGHSACMWLTMSPTAKLTSVDISTSESTNTGAAFVKEKFGERFDFICHDSKTVYDLVKDFKFDLVIVDGGHTEEDAYCDLELTKRLGAKYVIVDDMVMLKDIKNAIDRFEALGYMKHMQTWRVGWGVSLHEMIYS